MNYMYTPGALAGTQVPYQPTFLPQGVIGTQLGQLGGNFLGQFLPGPFGAIASQLLPQVGNLLPFQAGPQSGYFPQGVMGNPFVQAGGIAGQGGPQGPYGGIGTQWIPQAGTIIPFQSAPQSGYFPQGVMGNPFLQAGGIAGQGGLQGQYGGIGTQWMPQAGTVIPFQSAPQSGYFPQGVMGNPFVAGGIAGQGGLQGPYGGFGTQWMPQTGTVTPFQGPQAVFVPQGFAGGQLGQLPGGILGHVLPGSFAGIGSQLLPQVGSVLFPFQAGPQQPVPIPGYGVHPPFVAVGVQW